MKTCKECKVEKDIQEFPWKNKAKGIRVGRCNICHNKWYKAYFSKTDNKKKQIERVNSVNKKQIEKAREYVYEYLVKNPCVDCGEKNPIVLEFDHRETLEKAFSICSALSSHSYVSMELLVSEIEKCDIRCANCHRIKTAKQQNYWKFRLLTDGADSSIL
jgi:hypothetical protein